MSNDGGGHKDFYSTPKWGSLQIRNNDGFR